MALFSQDFIERVRSANELSQVAESYGVQLKRAGSNMLGLCPFHNEKTPSFNIRVAEQFFRCFGCGAKGDVFRFVQMKEGVEFPEAVGMLAERAGLPVEFDSPVDARKAQRQAFVKKALLRCCSLALDYFAECLAGPKGAAAREYLHRRGFEKETVERWRLGWSPNVRDGLTGFLLKNAKELGDSGQVIRYMADAGLLNASSRTGEHYEPFRGRVIFPIMDVQYRPIAFGGRILEDRPDAPKYVNSREGRLFEKRRVLFGLNHAAKEISLSGEAVLVEGYTDVIMCHQYGVRNVVAALGTSLTEEHVGILGRYIKDRPNGKVIAFFDSDSAGQKATRRAIDMFMQQGVPLAVASGLESKDAGDYLPEYGVEAFREKLQRAESGFTYLLEQTLGRADAGDPQARALAVREAVKTVNLHPEPVTRAMMRTRLAAEAGVPEETLPEPAERMPAAPGGAVARKARPPVRKGLSPPTAALDMEETLARTATAKRNREARLLRYMWENPDWCARIVDVYPPDDWRDDTLSELAALVRDEWDAEKPPVLNDIRARVSSPDAAERLADLAFPDAEPLSEKDMSQILALMLEDNRKEEARMLRGEMEKAQKAGDLEAAAGIWARIMSLKRGGRD